MSSSPSPSSSEAEMSQDETRRVQEKAVTPRAKEATSTDRLSKLLASIQKSQARFEKQLSAFKEEVRQDQEDAATKALKRARHKKPYQFCRKGNKEQASFNADVEEALSKAQLDLPDPEPRQRSSVPTNLFSKVGN